MKRLLSISLIALLSFLLSSCGDGVTKSAVSSGNDAPLSGTAAAVKGSVISPVQGAIWKTGSRYLIKWNPKRLSGKVYVLLYQCPTAKAYGCKLKFNSYISDLTANDGRYSWKIPSNLSTGNYYYIYVYEWRSANSWGSSLSGSRFTIKNVGGGGSGAFKVTTPNGGESWKLGKKYSIKWNKGSAGSYVKIQLLKSGKVYKWIAKKTKNDGTHRWKIPSTVATGSAYKIRVQSVTKSAVKDDSDSNFTITGGGTTGGSKDYKYLNRHNAYALDGHTVRWASKTIQVSGAKGAWRNAVNRWNKFTNVRFKYVASKPPEGKGIQILGYKKGGWPGLQCGKASYLFSGSGKLLTCKITMNPSSDCRRYELEQNIMTHEIGHCIGVFKHTSDGGLMDPTVKNNNFTLPVRKMINLLYSLSPGTNINSKFARRPTGMYGSRPSKYDPSGRKRYSGTSYFMKNGDVIIVRDK